jgi:hypothetical protein
MTNNVVKFPGAQQDTRQLKTSRGDDRERAPNMHTVLFRSYDLIVEADEADLVRDVGFDIEKAKRKLKKAQHQLRAVQEHAAARIQQLATVEAKLGGAIVAALLSTRHR